MNSTRGQHLTDGELLSCSSRRRGHVRLRAGMEKAPMWLPLASEPLYKAFTAVSARITNPLFCCSSGSVIDSSVFGVSCRIFPSALFDLYGSCFSGVAQPLGRVRHGRRRARIVQRLMQLVLPLGASCLGDHVGTLAVAVDPTGGEKLPVRAVIAVVSAGNCADECGHSVSGGLI